MLIILSSELQGNVVNLRLEFYFYDAWLWLYHFSKLRKIVINLAVSNYWMFQITGIYVKVGGNYYHGCGYHYPDPSSWYGGGRSIEKV